VCVCSSASRVCTRAHYTNTWTCSLSPVTQSFCRGSSLTSIASCTHATSETTSVYDFAPRTQSLEDRIVPPCTPQCTGDAMMSPECLHSMVHSRLHACHIAPLRRGLYAAPSKRGAGHGTHLRSSSQWTFLLSLSMKLNCVSSVIGFVNSEVAHFSHHPEGRDESSYLAVAATRPFHVSLSVL